MSKVESPDIIRASLLIPNWVELGLKILSYISFLNLSARVAVLIFSVDLYSPP